MESHFLLPSREPASRRLARSAREFTYLYTGASPTDAHQQVLSQRIHRLAIFSKRRQKGRKGQ